MKTEQQFAEVAGTHGRYAALRTRPRHLVLSAACGREQLVAFDVVFSMTGRTTTTRPVRFARAAFVMAAAATLASCKTEVVAFAAASAPASARAPGALWFPGCVVHAGDSHKVTRTALTPDGGAPTSTMRQSCSLNAECVQVKGHRTAGDGTLAIDCHGDECVCTIEPLWPRAPRTKVRFRMAHPCEPAGRTETLLLERCNRRAPGAAAERDARR